MIETAEAEVRLHYSAERDTIYPHFTGVRACFAPQNSGAAWNQHKSRLTGSDLTGLRHTAVHLCRHVNESVLADGEMGEVFRAIDEMSQSLSEEKLSKHVRSVLEERLAAIRRALEDYRFWGVSDIDRAYRDFVATLIMDVEVRVEVQKIDAKGQFWKKASAVIVTLAALVQLATGSVELGQKTLPFIERFILPAPSISQPNTNAPADHSRPDGVIVDGAATNRT